MEEIESTSLADTLSAPPKTVQNRHSLGLIALLLLAYALRILLLDEQSIWWDEGISLHLAVSSIIEIVSDRLSNIHPPLYFMLLKGWLTLAGLSAFSGRYLSLIASWLQVVVIFVIARRWFSKRTGISALLLAAISAVSIIYGRRRLGFMPCWP